MHANRFVGPIVVTAAVIAAAGCSRSKTAPAEDQAISRPQPVNQPVSLTGCLRSGTLAANTFVLNSAKTQGDLQAGTYQLNPAAGVEIGNYAGQEVEVTGTLRTEQAVASTGTATKEPAKGTTGTPTVQTKTELQVGTVDVTAIKPTGNKCPE